MTKETESLDKKIRIIDNNSKYNYIYVQDVKEFIRLLKEAQFNLDNETSYTKEFREVWIKQKENALKAIDKLAGKDLI